MGHCVAEQVFQNKIMCILFPLFFSDYARKTESEKSTKRRGNYNLFLFSAKGKAENNLLVKKWIMEGVKERLGLFSILTMKVLNIGKTDRHHPNLQKNIEKPKVEILLIQFQLIPCKTFISLLEKFWNNLKVFKPALKWLWSCQISSWQGFLTRLAISVWQRFVAQF